MKKIKTAIGDRLLKGYALLFGRPFFRNINRLLLQLGLRGLGILNYQDFSLSGEREFARSVLDSWGMKKDVCIFDVGAHEGEYARMILGLRMGALSLHCFEPSPVSFSKLLNLQDCHFSSIILNKFGLSDKIDEKLLYDIDSMSGSQLSSLYLQGNGQAYSVELRTGDSYCDQNRIEQIDLLKIDVEGHELAVLHGFKKMIKEGRVHAIQFEFNTTNQLSRTSLDDFSAYLHRYRLFRLMPKGRMMKMDKIDSAIYLYQNVVALLDR